MDCEIESVLVPPHSNTKWEEQSGLKKTKRFAKDYLDQTLPLCQVLVCKTMLNIFRSFGQGNLFTGACLSTGGLPTGGSAFRG